MSIGETAGDGPREPDLDRLEKSEGPTERVRLFVAVELPGRWKEALGREAQSLEAAAPGFARWVDPSLLHITLAFLGAQPAASVVAIQHAIDQAAAASSAFTLSLGSMGCFGGPRSIRVVWTSVEDAPRGSLGSVREAVIRALQADGVTFDPGRFQAHVTLARARREAASRQSEAMYRAIAIRRERPAAARDVGEPPAAFDCREITLVKSDLRPTGPFYAPLHRARLPGRTG